MSWMRSVSRWLLWTGVVLIGTAGAASAQNATLYEVTETMKLRGRGPENRTRSATAALSGTIQSGTTLCPAELAAYLGIPKCSVVAIASDHVNLQSGKGPVKGSFAVVIQGDNKVDGDELVIARGTLRGRIDLLAAIHLGLPLGGLEGKWWAEGERGGPLDGLKVYGRVSGVFRLPFMYGVPVYLFDDVATPPCEPAYWPVCPVKGNERSLDVPTVRLDLNFVTTGYGDDDRDRRHDRDRD